MENQAAEQAEAAEALVEELNHVDVIDDDEAAATAAADALVAFLRQKPNCKCADCASPLDELRDAWISTPIGVVVCHRCAAAHRSLGSVHTRVKSPVFDRWTVESARTITQQGDNAAARRKYLAELPAGYKEPGPDTPEERVRAFVRQKYVRLRWAEAELRAAHLAAQKSAGVQGRAKAKAAPSKVRSLGSDA